jgi:hypothetical protein
VSSIMTIQLNQRNETSKIHTDCAPQHDVLVAFEMSVTVAITHALVELKNRIGKPCAQPQSDPLRQATNLRQPRGSGPQFHVPPLYKVSLAPSSPLHARIRP